MQQTVLFGAVVWQQPCCSFHAWRQSRTAAASDSQLLHPGVTTSLYLLDLRGRPLQSDLCLLCKSIRAVVAPLIDHGAVIYRCDEHCCQRCLKCLSSRCFEAFQAYELCNYAHHLGFLAAIAIIEEANTTASSTRGMRVRLRTLELHTICPHRLRLWCWLSLRLEARCAMKS